MRNQLDDKLYSKLQDAGIVMTSKVAQLVQDKNQSLFGGTSLHIIIVTLRCNQCCIYCHSASKHETAEGYDMDEETARKTVDFIFQTPSEAINIEFQGGEPLLNFPIIKYIVQYAREKNLQFRKKLHFSLVTNLTLMNDDILQFLVKENMGICTSLDGPKHIHDANRKYLDSRGSYDDVVRWIKVIMKNHPHRLNALTVVTRYSLDHAKDVVDELVSHGFKKIWFKPANFLGFAMGSWNKVGYSPERYVEFYKGCLDHIVMDNIPVRDIFTTFILKKILLQEEPNFLDLQSPCGAAIGQLAYRYDGVVYACDEGRMVPDDVFRLGTVDQTYRDIMTSPQTCSLICASINDLYLCDRCVFKPYCGLCPVCNYTSQGTLIPKLPLDSRCTILKGIFTYIFDKLLFEPEFSQRFKDWVDTKNQI
jgi:His-Xaa-Ser system radical SAM maturase HxsB